MAMQESAEVWKNTAAGMRWVKVLDRQNREVGKTIPGGRTFTISTFDRQNNQDMAAAPELDLFRNGTFVLVRQAEETQMDEIESSDSLTDAELAGLVHEIMGKNTTVEAAIRSINSPVTLGRLMEALVIEDAPSSAIKVVRAKKNKIEPGAAVEREVITPEEDYQPPSTPNPTRVPKDEPEDEEESVTVAVTKPEE